MDWAMKTKGYNQRRACALAGSIRVCIGERRSIPPSPVARQDEGVGVRAASVWLSPPAHPAEA